MRLQTQAGDRIWFLMIAIVILALGSMPFWAGKSAETEEKIFRGIFFDETDYAVHISMMQAGRLGEWAYQMRFTSEEHSPAFIRIFYLALGHVSRWLNLEVEPTFRFARWIFGAGALFSIYQLCFAVFSNRGLARAAFFISVFGSGLGWLQLMLKVPMKPISPIDFWLIDAYVWFSISLFPSFSFTLALMCTATYLYLTFLSQGEWKAVFAVGLLAVISQMTNPIAFATVNLALIGATLFESWKARSIHWKQFFALGFVGVVQIPLLVYNYLILQHDPVWRQFTIQNQTLSPPPSFYLYGFAPLWVFAAYGMLTAFGNRKTSMISMSAWVAGGFILAYLPVLIQRRFLLGITIPLGILSIYGINSFIESLTNKWKSIKKREGLLYFAYVSAASISAIYLLFGLSLHLRTHPVNKFYSRDLENALIWLDQNAGANEFALGTVTTGQLVAQRTGLKTYIGHEMETLHYYKKQAVMQDYYRGVTSADWILQTPIEWVIYGPYEKDIAPLFSPDHELSLVYENSTVAIYKVKK